MTTVRDIANYLEERVPSSLRLDFDNVGLLCGFPEREVSRVLVVLDTTLQVIEEARSIGAELIVSHHPIIFTPLRTVCTDAPDARRVIALLQGNLSAICLHTNLDALEGGVNTALAAAVGAEISEYWRDIGCFCRLPEELSLKAFLTRMRTALSAKDIRFYDAARHVEHIALCGGAGGDILYEAARRGCDTVLTGEVKHHQWIDGSELGLNIIEGGHFATENVVIPPLADILRQGFPNIDVCLSQLQSSLSHGFDF